MLKNMFEYVHLAQKASRMGVVESSLDGTAAMPSPCGLLIICKIVFQIYPNFSQLRKLCGRLSGKHERTRLRLGARKNIMLSGRRVGLRNPSNAICFKRLKHRHTDKQTHTGHTRHTHTYIYIFIYMYIYIYVYIYIGHPHRHISHADIVHVGDTRLIEPHETFCSPLADVNF